MWTLDAELVAPGITLQTRTYRWPSPFESLESTECHSAMLTLSRWPPTTVGRYCPGGRDGRFVPIGSVTFAPANVPMHWRTDGGCVKLLQCKFDQARFRTLTSRDSDWEPAELEASLDIRGTRLDQVLAQLLGELTGPGFATSALVEALGIELMIGLGRYFGKVQNDVQSGGKPSALPISRLTDYIESLASPSPSIGELAAVCGVSRRKLMRLFKADTGLTVHAYVEQVRLAKAKALLSDTDIQLKEIAFRLGFSSPATFSAAFHKSVGEPPGAFRRRFSGSS